ncbi:cisplatin damage response ATP-dependent DNA ligase [Acidisoma cladoniae]|jgi:DNA ligase-1|uniref:cisplatin damage response ATP-dependent DNA ligase n=1 Tax=Acidisoma cladoniae TaxID=3040935 RepID=UPI0025518B98|nr:cisplatin damage response ATP-dependent DNA ligase [Acidisoma sp. PAMC 29798]
MTPFAALLERLVFTPGRLAKIALLRDYFSHTPDPDRGYALAAIAGDLSFVAAKPAMIRQITAERVDPTLFEWSYDYVGDLAETVSLIWPDTAPGAAPRLSEVVDALHETTKTEMPARVAAWMDVCDPSERLALLKLITGGLRVGASARLAKIALGEMAGLPADDIEEVWHGLLPPYQPLFDWLEGRAPKPDAAGAPVFRPTMLAHPLEEADAGSIDWAAYRAEWKWDGIRVQLVATAGGHRLYTRTAEDISHGFPEILAAMEFQGVLDGELLVVRDGQVAPFGDLQQRLNRKSPGAKMLAEFPAAVRLYDILFDGDADLRALPFDERRVRLEQWVEQHHPERMDISPLIPFAGPEDLAELRLGARAASIEGLMLKRGDSPYLAGRPKGPWWKWKRDPLSIDAVLMYAQRGHGRRSSIYSDYTFGLWREDGVLVPVGKAYSGITDQELGFLDKWVRSHTTGKFGPVREVEKALVLEIVFDAAQLSTRHKSGVALRFPRISRIRADKPAAEADRLDSLMARVPPSGALRAETLVETDVAG